MHSIPRVVVLRLIGTLATTEPIQVATSRVRPHSAHYIVAATLAFIGLAIIISSPPSQSGLLFF